MGTGERAQRAAYGAAIGQAQAQLEFERGLLPIMLEQTQIDIERERKFQELELEHTESLYLLAQRLEDETQKKSLPQVEQPIYVTQAAAATPKTNYAIYAALAIAYFLLRSKK